MTLAIPNFVSGSYDEALSAADAYGMSSLTSLPIIDDLLNMFGKDFNFSEKFGAAKEFIQKNKPLIKSITDKGKLVLNSKGSLTERLLAGSSLASTALSGLSPGLGDQLNKYVSDNKDTLVKIGDVVNKVNGADLTDISSLGKLITGVTGDSSLFSINDKEGISSLCSSIAAECSKLGLPNTLTELSKSMTDNSVIVQAAQKLLPDAVKGGDFNLFNEISSILPTGTGSAQYPSAIKDFLTNFKLPNDVKISDIPQLYTKLTDSFGKFDSKWLKETSGYTDTIKGAVVSTASEDAKKVICTGILNSEEEDERMLSLAALYGGTDVDHEFFKLYPTAAIGSFQRKQTEIKTPTPDNEIVYIEDDIYPLKLTMGGFVESDEDAQVTIRGLLDPGNTKPIVKNIVVGDPLW